MYTEWKKRRTTVFELSLINKDIEPSFVIYSAWATAPRSSKPLSVLYSNTTTKEIMALLLLWVTVYTIDDGEEIYGREMIDVWSNFGGNNAFESFRKSWDNAGEVQWHGL